MKFNKGATSPLLLAAMIIGAVFAGLYLTGNFKLPGQASVTPPASVDTGVCGQNPSVVSTATNALQSGSSLVTTGTVYRVNGVYQGTTSPTVKGSVDAMFILTGYLNTIKSQSIGCGSNPIQTSQYAAATPTVTILGQVSGVTLVNSTTGVAGNNETKGGAGASYNDRIHFVGTNLNSTGQMLVIVDYANATSAIASASLTPISGAPYATPLAAIPKGYASLTSGGAQYAFLIPAIVGANTADYNLQTQAASSSVVAGAVRISLYSLQPFVETDGTFNPGTTAWDSVGTAKYAVVQNAVFYIQ